MYVYIYICIHYIYIHYIHFLFVLFCFLNHQRIGLKGHSIGNNGHHGHIGSYYILYIDLGALWNVSYHLSLGHQSMDDTMALLVAKQET